ncbi:3-octaprenyl-4-hydroxybenzoate carboxy-lyase [Thermoplasma volcanium GSS1]|uniref:Flavin prenyltransferase UbiX n=1 Tax=Thermoplasma volcanium (strain ATCC 51530 / DSM 4299 / JCM 9571 / NBRC 15438 / GSS1) TaxID=273116 RepID=Q97BJ5_THEVO|nr:UbiX family flavin prenyltransferase [Thermoplasma volcanium]BAB59602.1 3-octaprenyl-4-hydroxybenzoate carboxy-lyase [Thermoplasma volcanium GSS1]
MRIVVGVSGASGIPYAVKLLENLGQNEVHLIISENAKKVMKYEMNQDPSYLSSLASYTYSDDDFTAPVSSGSFLFDAMVIVPCSISTLSKIAVGISDTLITRAAAVSIKERRRLIIVPREMPLSSIDLKNMLSLSENGVIIAPASPGFYNKPKSIDDLVSFVVSRILDLIGVKNELIKRWQD